MSYDDAYALLLTREARFEQNQNAKAMFNANYSMINANHSYMRKTLRRGPYGGGTGMLFSTYAIGFPASSSNFGVYYRGQAMQIYKWNTFHPPTIIPAIHSGESDESVHICQIYHK